MGLFRYSKALLCGAFYLLAVGVDVIDDPKKSENERDVREVVPYKKGTSACEKNDVLFIFDDICRKFSYYVQNKQKF